MQGLLTSNFVMGLTESHNENIFQVHSCYSKFFAVTASEIPIVICSTVSVPIPSLRVLSLFHNLANVNLLQRTRE